MDLYVVRHAVAHKRDEKLWPDDAKRPLTPEGEERFPRCWGNTVVRYQTGAMTIASYRGDT
jgi:phosphohistidine phosphatase SixA